MSLFCKRFVFIIVWLWQRLIWLWYSAKNKSLSLPIFKMFLKRLFFIIEKQPMGVSGPCVCVCWMAAPLPCSPVWQQSQHPSPLQCKRPNYSCSKREKDREEVNERWGVKALPLFLPPSSPFSLPLFILQSLSARVNPSPFPSLLPFGCFLLLCFYLPVSHPQISFI